MVLRRVGIWSAAKLSCILYAAMGLVLGAFMTLFAVAGSVFGFGGQQVFPGGVLFGMGSIVVLPILYGLMGLVTGAMAAGLYDLAAGWIGGLELEFESSP